MQPTNRIWMTYRSNWSDLVDESAGAGMLLRSTIDGVFSNKAFCYWYMKQFGMVRQYVSFSDIQAEAYIRAAKRIGETTLERMDVIRILSSSVSAAYKKLYEGKAFKYASLYTNVTTLAENVGMDDTAYLELKFAHTYIQPNLYDEERIPELIEDYSFGRAKDALYGLMKGLTRKEIGEELGVSRQVITQTLLNFRNSQKGKRLIQELCN